MEEDISQGISTSPNSGNTSASFLVAKIIILFGIMGVFIGAVSRLTVVDLDMFHEMALFREFVLTHAFPKGDVFSYVPTLNSTVHHEWGLGAILYFVTVVTGWGGTGLLLLKYLLCAGVCFGVYTFANRYRTGLYVFAPISIIAIALGWIGFTTIRAQLFSLFFLVILFNLLESDRAGRKLWVAIWLPLFLIWLNVHAGFLLGVGFIIFYTLELFTFEFLKSKSFSKALLVIRHLLAVLFVMCILLVVNPWGGEYISYLWRAVTLDRSNLITEWEPLWHNNLSGLLLFFISLIILVYCLFCSKCQNFALLLFTCATAWLAFGHFRYLSIYALSWVCFVSVHLKKTNIGKILFTFGTQKHIFYISIWLLIGIAGSLFATWNKFWLLRIPTTAVEHAREGVPVYPAGAVQFLRDNHFVGNLMVPFEAGSYISWKLYPAVKVSMDSRFEVAYPMSVFLENEMFYQGKKNWESISYKYSTDAILVPNWSELGKKVSDRIGTEKGAIFRRVYEDDAYSIFVCSQYSTKMVYVERRGTFITDTFP